MVTQGEHGCWLVCDAVIVRFAGVCATSFGRYYRPAAIRFMRGAYLVVCSMLRTANGIAR